MPPKRLHLSTYRRPKGSAVRANVNTPKKKSGKIFTDRLGAADFSMIPGQCMLTL